MEERQVRVSLFRQRVFGGLWTGAIASSIGSSAGMLAINWLVYEATGSAFDVALMGLAGLVPRIVFGIFSGALADRYSRLRLMVLADGLRAAAMVAFALNLILSGFHLFVVLFAVFVLGVGQSLFRPAINSFLPTAVSHEDLGTANGLFSAAQEVTSIVGSPLGGILIGTVGVAATLLFNSASYITSGLLIIFVALSISARLPKSTSRPERVPFAEQLKGGFSYVNRERGLLKITIASFGANFFLTMFITFFVIYVYDVLKQGPLMFGILAAAVSTGFGTGSLLVGRTRTERRFGTWFGVLWGIAGFSMLGVVFAPSTIIAAVFLFLFGLFGGYGNTTFFTGVQKFVPNNVLGRYLSLDEVGSLGAGPAGQLAGGLLIAASGIGFDYTIAAIGTIAFCLGLLLFPDVRALKVA